MKGDVLMSEKEINQIDIFERLKKREMTQKKASELLGLSVRQVKRKLRMYRLKGAKSLVHQGRGKTSNRKIDQAIIDTALDTIRQKYLDFGPTLAHEKLVENHGFEGSLSLIRAAMIREGLWSPQKRRKAHVHQLRERRACFGELVQLDGSPHDWFEGRRSVCNLNVGIDDATGQVFCLFSEVETTQDYFRLMTAYLSTFGLPRALYVDKHSVFKVNKPTNLDYKKPQKDDEFAGLTQFGRAMKELHIELIFANTPQSKGRVERVNQTLQDRLVKELRLRNISTIQEANLFLPSFLHTFNQKFNVPAKSNIDMHRKLPPNTDLSKIGAGNRITAN